MEILHIIALAALLLTAPFLLGMFFGRKTISGTYLAGTLFLWGSFEAVAVAANLRGWDFQMLSRRFLYVLVVLVCGGMAAFCVRIIKSGKEKGIGKINRGFLQEMLFIVPAFLLAGSLFFVYAPKLESWYLVPETVNTILDTNSLHGFNALTGQSLSSPKESGWSLMNLPGFYACLADWFQMNVMELLFRCIPLWMLFISFLVYYQFAAYFFEKWKNGRIFFMWIYALVLFFGDSAYMNEAYQMLHYAYEGRAVLTGILLPYCFYLLLTAFSGFWKRGKEREGKEDNKRRGAISSLLIWLAEYAFLMAGGLFALGADYGLGLLLTMTALSCAAGILGTIVKRVRRPLDN